MKERAHAKNLLPTPKPCRNDSAKMRRDVSFAEVICQEHFRGFGSFVAVCPPEGA